MTGKELLEKLQGMTEEELELPVSTWDRDYREWEAASEVEIVSFGGRHNLQTIGVS